MGSCSGLVWIEGEEILASRLDFPSLGSMDGLEDKGPSLGFVGGSLLVF